MIWTTTRRIIDNFYFAFRHYCFYILAALNCSYLPFIRQAEKQLKPHNEHLLPHYTWTEKFGLGFCPVVLFIFPVAITFAIAFIIPFPFLVTRGIYTPIDSITILSGYLQIIATVLATLTALLLAVIALTIQVKTSDLAGADFLLNAVIRRRGFLPVAAFLSGTVLTALLGVVFSNRFSLRTLNDYTFVTVILAVASLLILFDLLRRTMQTLGTSELNQLLSAELTSSLRISFKSKLRQGLLEKHFSERLADLGFARLYTTEKQEVHPTEYNLKRLGKIFAIDPAPLKRISQILKLTPLPHERNTSQVLLYRPENKAPYITVQPTGKVKENTCLALLTREQSPSKQISKLIQKAFVIRRKSNMEPDWQRLRQVMSSAITKYESTTVTNVAKAITDTVDDYLSAQNAIAGESNLVLEDFTGDLVYGFKPPHPFNLRLSESAIYAARNRSHDCLDELLNCIYELAQIAFDKQNEKYFHDWIFQFFWSYYSFGSYAKDPDITIAPDITRRMHWLSNYLLSADIYGQDKSAKRIQKVTPYAINYLSLCLHMLRTSAERYDQSTFDAVAEHVMHFLKNELKDNKAILDIYRNSGQNGAQQDSSQLDDNGQEQKLALAYNKLYDYKNLVYVIASAWLVNKVKLKKLQPKKVAPFLEKLIDNTSDFRSLLDLYAMPGMADRTLRHEDPLGFADWDWPHSYYSKAKYGTNFQRWIRPFYQFLLLKKASRLCSTGINVKNIPQTESATHESLKKFLSAIAAEGYSLPAEYQDVPWSIEPKDLEMAKKQLKRVLDSWSK